MDVLLRHTILGEWLRHAGANHLDNAEEHNVASLKKFNTLREAQRQESSPDETIRLLADAEGIYHIETRIVDWYGDDDFDVSNFMLQT
jgi:hypothetical protein